MRHIPFDAYRPSPEWTEKARRAFDRVQEVAVRLDEADQTQAPEVLKELRQAVNRQSEVWAELKAELAALSFGKCWYCESAETRSDMAVDHFRPKSGVQECKTHRGYWWLAFRPTNYRYACGFCNSPHVNGDEGKALGKGTHFPLLDETVRVHDPAGDVGGESPCLLDPVIAIDPSLLWFLDDGSATPTYTEERSPEFYLRAYLSIAVYNLNDVRVKEVRFVNALEIKRQVVRGDKYLNDAMVGIPAAREHFQESCRVIASMIRPKAEFSAAARAILAGYRDKEWVSALLVTV